MVAIVHRSNRYKKVRDKGTSNSGSRSSRARNHGVSGDLTMDRSVLLALLGLPILVVIHIMLLSPSVPLAGVPDFRSLTDLRHSSPAAFFAVNPDNEQGS
jgi:hypothetical protein